MKNRKLLLVILILLFVTAAAFLIKFKKINNSGLQEKEFASQNGSITNKEPENVETIPEPIKEIIDNNVTGTVIRADNKTLVVETENSQKEFSFDKNSYIYRIKDKIENKKISDIKVGMDIYIQFDKETRAILTATIK